MRRHGDLVGKAPVLGFETADAIAQGTIFLAEFGSMPDQLFELLFQYGEFCFHSDDVRGRPEQGSRRLLEAR